MSPPIRFTRQFLQSFVHNLGNLNGIYTIYVYANYETPLNRRYIKFTWSRNFIMNTLNNTDPTLIDHMIVLGIEFNGIIHNFDMPNDLGIFIDADDY